MAYFSYSGFYVGTMAWSAPDEDGLQAGIKQLKNSIDTFNNASGNVAGCFGWYWGRQTEGHKKFVFGFRFLPVWITEFVEEFNQAFKNISLEILHLKPIYIVLGTPNSQRMVTDEIPKSGPNAYSMLFRFHFSKEYPAKIIPYIEYTLHHFVRQLSFQEFIWNSAQYLMDMKFSTTLEFPHLHASIFRSNNEKDKYRALAEKKITLNNILNFDSIERANAALLITKKVANLRQTECLAIFTKRGTFCPDRRMDYDKKIFTFKFNNGPFESPEDGISEFELLYNGMYVKRRTIDGKPEYRGYAYIKNCETGRKCSTEYRFLECGMKRYADLPTNQKIQIQEG